MPDTASLNQTVELIDQLRHSGHRKVKTAVVDIDGILRGKVIHLNKFHSVLDGGFGFCDVVFGWDSADQLYDNVEVTGWHTGYPDTPCHIDLSTRRHIPWDDQTPFFLSDVELAIAPRTLLRKLRQEAVDMGYTPLFSQEFEWFNFRASSESAHDADYKNLETLSRGMFGYSVLRASQNSAFFNAIFEQMADFDVPLEGLHTETGPGVYEAAILYGDILEAADRAVLFKSGVKELGRAHGVLPSFMAKWSTEYPGCSGHVHQSLWDAAGSENLFYGNDGMSPVMESYLAGLLHCLPYVMPMYAPTVNSYKRLVEGFWAPTTVCWGRDNRTTTARILGTSPSSSRIELRVVGSDANPYLAMAASLASGLYGIKNQLKLTQAESRGDGCKDPDATELPRTLHEATVLMKNSELPRELFGEDFVQHFVATREWEWNSAMQAVSDWELKRYFEII